MGLRKKDSIHARLCGAVRDVRTVAILGVIGPNGDVFQFSDNLQSGLPDLRDKFIKG
jgi:hypothetical protein